MKTSDLSRKSNSEQTKTGNVSKSKKYWNQHFISESLGIDRANVCAGMVAMEWIYLCLCLHFFCKMKIKYIEFSARSHSRATFNEVKFTVNIIRNSLFQVFHCMHNVQQQSFCTNSVLYALIPSTVY